MRTAGACVLPVVIVGMMEASATRKFSTSWTRSRESTTDISSVPILAVGGGRGVVHGRGSVPDKVVQRLALERPRQDLALDIGTQRL